VSNLLTGDVFILASEDCKIYGYISKITQANDFVIGCLKRLDAKFGNRVTGTLKLPRGILIHAGSALFSGVNCAVVVDSIALIAIRIDLVTGELVVVSPQVKPRWTQNRDWTSHGVFEQFDGVAFITYGKDGVIERQNVLTGDTSLLFFDGGLSDLSSFIVDPVLNMWFFRYKGSGVFGHRKTLLGTADAVTLCSKISSVSVSFSSDDDSKVNNVSVVNNVSTVNNVFAHTVRRKRDS